jgi:hypothetical protein
VGFAARNDSDVVFGFAVPNRTGTFGVESGMNAILTIYPSLQNWIALSGMGGNGTVTVTSFDDVAKRVSGTFTFNLAPNPSTGATGEKQVTQGVFDFTFVDQ